MTLGFENAAQLRELFLSCGMGFLLGAYYDVFRLFRCWLLSSPLRVFVQDCTYALTSAVAVFLFALALNGGVLRWYLFLGLFVGFFAYRRTVGSFLIKTVLKLLRCIEKLAQKAENRLLRLLCFFSKKAKAFFGSIFDGLNISPTFRLSSRHGFILVLKSKATHKIPPTDCKTIEKN